MATWISIGKGIVYREHETRKHGRIKDRYYALSYRHGGKKVFEAVGWLSNGIDLNEIEKTSMQLALNRRLGTPPFSLKEKREIEETQKAKAATLAIEEIEAERIEQESQKTLEQFYAETYDPWLLQQSIKSKGQIKNEQGLYRNWIKPLIGNVLLKDLSLKQYEIVVNAMRAKEREPQTQIHAANLMSQIWDMASEHYLMPKNARKKIKIQKPNSRRMRTLTFGEIKALLKELRKRSVDIHDITLVATYTGMRASEIANLIWADIADADGIINIKDPKNNESRVAYILKEIRTMIDKRRCEQNPKKSDKVFPHGLGQAKPQVSDTYNRAVAALGYNNGVEDRRQKVVFHTLRHTFGSWLAAQSVSPYNLKELMGHKDIETTMIYVKHDPEGLKRSAQTLETLGKLTVDIE